MLSAQTSLALGRAPIPGPGAGRRDGEVNTHFTIAAGKLYALVEAGDLPVELDESLESVARSDFGGTLEAGFAAHPRYDPGTGVQHAIAYEPGLPVRYVTLDAAGRAATVARIDLPQTPMIHDLAFTATSIVVLDLPVTFRPESARTGRPWLWDEHKDARVGLLPRDGDVGRLRWFEAPRCFVFHLLNAYDDGDRTSRRGPGRGCPRWRGGRSTGRAAGRSRRSSTSAARSSRASMAPSPVGPIATDTPRDRVSLRAHTETPRIHARMPTPARPSSTTWSGNRPSPRLRPRARHGRAGLRPAPGAVTEDDGWILSYVYDAGRDRSDVVILGVRDFGGDPVATIHLPVRVPYGFHGGWVPDGSPIPPVA